MVSQKLLRAALEAPPALLGMSLEATSITRMAQVTFNTASSIESSGPCTQPIVWLAKSHQWGPQNSLTLLGSPPQKIKIKTI